MYEKEILKTYKYCFIIFFVFLCVTTDLVCLFSCKKTTCSLLLNYPFCCHATHGEAFRDIPKNVFSK